LDCLAADWPAPPQVRALTTLRGFPGVSLPPFDRCNLGAHCGDDPESVRENRRLLRQSLALPAEPRWLRQVHGVAVARFAADSGREDEMPVADAAVTAEPGVVLAILTADCLPVLFCSRAGDEIAAVHAGWRGLAAGVLEQTLAAMRTEPALLLAWMGPAAGPQAYEVGQEVFAAFVADDADAESCFAPTRPGHWRMDLFELARRRLHCAGIPFVHGGGNCTIGDPQRYFSHRRDQRGGRMASLIWIGSA
jgi:YfiH family protein